MAANCADDEVDVHEVHVGNMQSVGHTVSRTASMTSSVAKAMSLEAANKSIEDLYAQSSDDRVIRDKTYQEVKREFPMVCYCSPDGPIKPCRFRPDGHRGRVPLKNKLLWAWPFFGWFALKYLKVGYMRKFYMDDYPKASLGIIAFSSVLSVLVDAFTDPNMATWTDNLKSKYGRRRPFVFASAFFVPVSFILAWLPLIVSPGLGASLWYGFFHIMYKLADTLFMIPLEAWGASLTPIYKEKTNIWQCKDLVSNTGILFGMAVAPIIFVTDQCGSTPDDGCLELPLISVFFGLIFLHGCLQLCWWGKEQGYDPVDQQRQDQERQVRAKFTDQDTIPMLISTFMNKPFRILLLTDIAKALGQEIPFNVLPFVTAWVLGEKCFSSSLFFSILVLLNLLCSLIGVPFFTWLASKTNKYRAYFVFHVVLAISSIAFVFISYDDGSCTISYVATGLAAFFGFAYGGTFLLFDLLSDVVDYDEFLTGGLRREASYIMAVDFVPKFMSIPGECVPFLMMAYFSYARPTPSAHRPTCDPLPAGSGADADVFCTNHYLNETLGANWCSESMSCQELFNSGVTFVCNNAMSECGIRQNRSVELVLLICFSVVPFFFVALGIVGLYFYPKNARSEAMQEKLVQATSRLRRGETVEDPWRPGSFVSPAEPPTANSGVLSYFTPSELKAVASRAPLSGGLADAAPLLRSAAILSVFFVVMIPVGCYVVGLGWEDLSDDLGASVSPLGLMLVGTGICGVWFNGVRIWAFLECKRNKVRHQEVVSKYNSMCPFTGAPRLPAVNQ